MDSRLFITLRRLNVTEPLPSLVEIESNDDVPTEADYVDPKTALKQFVAAARKLLPLQQEVDVYIGAWGQNTIQFPKEFIALIHETGWEVTVNIDD